MSSDEVEQWGAESSVSSDEGPGLPMHDLYNSSKEDGEKLKDEMEAGSEEEDSEDAEDEDDTEDEPEPGPVITLIESKSVSDPLFRLAEKTAFDAGESLYDAIPETVAGFFKDPPPPPPPPPAAVSQTGGTSPTGAVSPTPRKKITVATPPIPVPPLPKKDGETNTPPPPPGPPPNITPPPPPTTPPPPLPESK